MVISRQNKRLGTILLGSLSLLLIPLIAMNYSSQVQWGVFDFLIAGVLLMGTGVAIEIVIRKIRTRNSRILVIAGVLLLLLLLWAELAVGLFGSPIGGS